MTVERVAKWMLAAGVGCVFLYLYPTTWPVHALVKDLYANAATSLLSISVTVLLIDRLYGQRDAERRKLGLIREMGSSDHATAVRAANEMQAEGWLTDGSLAGVDLALANLESAVLKAAVLPAANLTSASLVSANLQQANLAGATLDDCIASGANLKASHLTSASLRSVNLVAASLDEADMSGRIDSLSGRYGQATLRNANLCDARLEECDLFECDLTGANLAGSVLLGANLAKAILDDVILERADLDKIIGWEQIVSMKRARIGGIRNAPDGFKAFAIAKGARES